MASKRIIREDAEKGYVAIDGGTFTIQSGRDGIQAETNLSIQSADLTIKTADGAQSQSLVTDESYKGLKAGGVMTISSGTFAIDSADDSLHANIPSSQVVRSLPTVVTTAYMRTMN